MQVVASGKTSLVFLLSVLLLAILPSASSKSASTMSGGTPEPQPVLLALPGPAFSHIDFDPDPRGEEECKSGAQHRHSKGSSRGLRFIVGGKPLLLDKSVSIDSDSHTEKTAGSVWDCSLVLAKYLEMNSETLLKDKHVMELGSGQGVVGIACALAGAKLVTVTDVDAALPGLEANLAVNGLEERARAKVLDWMKAKDQVAALGKIDTVVAADTVWVEDLAGPFVRALALSLASKGGARGVLCHRSRSTRTDKVLFAAMEGAGIEVGEVLRSAHDGTFRDPAISIYTLRLKLEKK